ncbi:MAG: poly-beta-1,6 N-acetyl-D-glucosamine export porin PgaA [Castellaniella sp.]|nr:MAG: poly-beta-1,6 N-acetyl-D-glucosamine export porin PgaA [Castellaniella sp.]
MALCAPAQDYDTLIQQARAGDYSPALTMLRQRLRQTPDDRRVLGDYILISGWAGHSKAITQAYEQAESPGNLSSQALNTVARAYRDTQRWNNAITLFQQGERRFHNQPAFTYGHIMTLADAGRTDDAIRGGRQLVAQQPRNADSHLALDYAYVQAGQPYAALEQASQAYDLAPARPYVMRAYILAQQRAQLPQAALRMTQAHPGVMDPAQTRSLQADVAAQLTRAASADSRGEASRFALADQALSLYDRLIAEWRAMGPTARADVQRAEADRLQALHARRRMRDVVTSYDAMRANGTPVPSYVLGDVASAYLYLQQPEKAAPLFQQSLATIHQNRTSANRLADQSGLFYALTESNQDDAANAGMDRAIQEQPIWNYYKGTPVREPNPLRMDAELTRAQGYLYEGDSVRAQQTLDQMVAAAPDNTNIRTMRAGVYRARDLPHHAERDLKIAESQMPRSIGVEVGQAETALALQEWHQAKLLRDDVAARAPEDTTVQRLAREWEVHNMAEWRMTASRGVTTNSPVLGSHEWNLDTVLYSPPIDENWRVFAGTGYSQGEFDEGNGYYGWARAGAEWRSRVVTAQAEVSGNRYGYGTKTGAAASVFVDLNDHWQVGAGAALLSRDTPLRALKHNITANSLNASLRWRGDDRREWVLTITPSFFSDGNNRLEASLSGRQRLYTAPKVKVDALLNLSGSHNTADDAPYFNPKSDLTVLPALQITHTLYQRYENRWEQQFLLGVGTYSQRNFGTGGIVTVGYGQRYRYNDVLDVGFMITGTSRPYDGQRERDYNFLVNMTYRF